MKVKNISDLKSKLESDESFLERVKSDPIEALNSEINPRNDPKVFKIVLCFVGFALIFSLVIAGFITLSDPVELINAEGKKYTQLRPLNQYFVMIGSASIGALAGLLVPRPD